MTLCLFFQPFSATVILPNKKHLNCKAATFERYFQLNVFGNKKQPSIPIASGVEVKNASHNNWGESLWQKHFQQNTGKP